MEQNRNAKGEENRDGNSNEIAIEEKGGNARHRIPTGLAGHGGLIERGSGPGEMDEVAARTTILSYPASLSLSPLQLLKGIGMPHTTLGRKGERAVFSP